MLSQGEIKIIWTVEKNNNLSNCNIKVALKLTLGHNFSQRRNILFKQIWKLVLYVVSISGPV